ncbi:MAG: exodeoxyribonuclease VII large subunit [Myxococcaceae bacterium]
MKQGDLFGGGGAPKPAEPQKRETPVSVSEPAYLRENEPPPEGVVRAQRAETVPEKPRPVTAGANVAPSPGLRPPSPVGEGKPATKIPAGPKILTVTELTWQIKEAIEPKFAAVFVRGEVSGFRGANMRGHLYFMLRDETASLDVRIWQSTAAKMKFGLKDGMEVIAEGSIDLYPPSGRYGLVINRIEPAGVGAQALAFEQLKQKLIAEGLMGEKRAKPRKSLPHLPRRIGVVTSVSGAALRDFLKVLHRRHPRISVLVSDARVQGDGAAFEIARGIRRLGRTDVDAIVVTRGGGSKEDLWAFNEEIVARAIFDSPKPVVSAVGHEVDTTLSDYVADVRAPTPSAAAEALAPVLADLELHLAQQKQRMRRALERRILAAKNQLHGLHGKLGDPRRRLSQQRLFLSEQAERIARVLRRAQRERRDSLKKLADRLQGARPQAKLEANRRELALLSQRLLRASPHPRVLRGKQQLASLETRLRTAINEDVAHFRSEYRALTGKLDALSPLNVLSRGYAIVQRAGDNHVVRKALDAPVGEKIRVRLANDEELAATVEPGQKKLL